MVDVVMRPIAVIHSPYVKPYHAPRQTNVDDRHHSAVVRLFPHSTAHQTLHDLGSFSHIWLISWFHRIQGWKPKVLPPRSRTKRGVLATRSPHRPNPIGISAVEVVSINGLNIRISGCDLLDGTPILDIKPYIPYADAFPNARSGWVDDIQTTTYHVVWECTQPANTDVMAHVERTLQCDPYPHPYRRIRIDERGIGTLAVEHWRVMFRIEDTTVVIMAVVAGNPT